VRQSVSCAMTGAPQRRDRKAAITTDREGEAGLSRVLIPAPSFLWDFGRELTLGWLDGPSS
jgi:hypothetical protein